MRISWTIQIEYRSRSAMLSLLLLFCSRLLEATELAIGNGAALRVYAVAPRIATHPGAPHSQQPGTKSLAETLREQLHDAVAELPSEARALPVFLWGAPAIELVAAAEAGVDMIVLGSRGGGRVHRALNGGVVGAVIKEAACPVLIAPAGARVPAAVLA
jgi:nucleotide-binding universal stress UspA family protein